MRTLRELQSFIEADSDLATLRDQIAPALSQDPGHDLNHALRVALWTIRLSSDDVAPREAIAAALCHDIVNVPKDSPDRWSASSKSADAARQLLPGRGFSDAGVDRIVDAVRDHSFSRGAVPTTELGRALQDADRLDALGAIGIFRLISTGVGIGTAYFHQNDPWASHRELDEKSFSVDHFFTKLLTLPDTMRTVEGRAEAQRRANVMEAFLDALADELACPRDKSGGIEATRRGTYP